MYINILDLVASANRARDSYEGVKFHPFSGPLFSRSATMLVSFFFLMLHFNDNGKFKLEVIHSNDTHTHTHYNPRRKKHSEKHTLRKPYLFLYKGRVMGGERTGSYNTVCYYSTCRDSVIKGLVCPSIRVITLLL